MSSLASTPPYSATESVTETMHGIPVTDPYRWLEDSDSPRTRRWVEEQRRYARAYLDSIPRRESIRQRIREFLAVETYDSLQIVGNHYVFRKRLPNQEQACIYMRDGAFGEEKLLLDPSRLGTGNHSSVKPLRVSRDGRLLLYETKEGGERTGVFALLHIQTCETLPDVLPRGYLRGFAFAPDNKSFYYIHEPSNARAPLHRAAYHHQLGTQFNEDREVFYAGDDENLRLALISDKERLGLLVYDFREKLRTTFYLTTFESQASSPEIVTRTNCIFGPRLVQGKILAVTDRDAPNLRIVELSQRRGGEPQWIDVIPERSLRINRWLVAGNCICVSYIGHAENFIVVSDLSEKRTTEIAFRSHETHRLLAGSPDAPDLLVETESFTEPQQIWHYTVSPIRRRLWAKKSIPFDSMTYVHRQISYTSNDGTAIPMYLMGRKDVLKDGAHPTIMTSYGGYGISMTPQFSVFVAFLVECGCAFALPSIRGGSDFGEDWHKAAMRTNRQKAYDDFLCAAEWLVSTGRATPDRLAIFGGSNSGLLVAAAMTQRPELFRAVVCLAPMLDMLRYHLFDNAHLWREEFGTAEDRDDFEVLASYSPYHRVREGAAYPAVMLVSGDADGNCNPLHARKMTARLQAANSSTHPIFLDYSPFRGHSPVLPLSDRVEHLTDRMAFLCDQLRLAV
jgi:prolyl oligopeptidase